MQQHDGQVWACPRRGQMHLSGRRLAVRTGQAHRRGCRLPRSSCRAHLDWLSLSSLELEEKLCGSQFSQKVPPFHWWAGTGAYAMAGAWMAPAGISTFWLCRCRGIRRPSHPPQRSAPAAAATSSWSASDRRRRSCPRGWCSRRSRGWWRAGPAGTAC